MRQKRAKTYRKLMALYSMTFGFRQPYQVLIDSNICTAAISMKLELVKQLGTCLQGEVKPMITQCCIVELYKMGPSHQPAVDLAKTFERRKCNHKEAIPGQECLESVVGETNKHRYVIASQSQPLRAKLRTIPAVPIVHIKKVVMVLEPPSDETLKRKDEAEEEALHTSAPERTKLPSVPVEEPKKKKGPKGPNPLSVKKKKPRIEVPPPKKQDTAAGMKRKREDNEKEGSEGVTENRKKKKRRRKAVQDTVETVEASE